MGVTFLLTAIGCLVGFSMGLFLAVFRKTKTILLLPLRIFIIYIRNSSEIPVYWFLMFYIFMIFQISDNSIYNCYYNGLFNRNGIYW